MPEFKRVGEMNGSFFYDLGNGRMVEIKNGDWQIVPSDALLFKSSPDQQPQPDPIKGGDPSKLFDYVRVPESSRLLTLVAVATCFIPHIIRPMLSFFGPQGSGKSNAQAFIKALVDPSSSGLSPMPRKVEDLPLLLSRRFMTGLDNISAFTNEVADILCAAITGGSLEKRVLHTDSDMIALKVPGVITCSSVTTSISGRPDLLERMVKISLTQITSGRRPEEELWADFDEYLPSILGGFLDLVAKAMLLYPEAKKRLFDDLPRMSDFSIWGYAIAEALGGQGEAFIDAYTHNRN